MWIKLERFVALAADLITVKIEPPSLFKHIGWFNLCIYSV